MKASRFGEEQIIAVLREHEAGARCFEAICRSLEKMLGTGSESPIRTRQEGSPATLLRSAVVNRSLWLVGHSHAKIRQNTENHDQKPYSF